ncbi:MAG: hypothetical protein AUJ81_03155 [Helicobacteraceae bacterium CG1_02_36_14]|nr:MAG: hypothetical protein AUJ81_03155 [Helicobacteraceae bacterium CG1_02_36_14]PIV02704.1 MAG: hypothetical protein COS56_10995 [Sulfurimonas sp. CG03_land_8_20_14_0_80_36_25]PIV60461.1 MAG: hypothetical protein COS13_06660 [Sulfurimonas sp. CG01_land_8_20_14_3_00_36_23]PIX63629.1 MAG: hypothetical protein COZ44_07390 [Sulfurimonas sp. CG_4_10_14_3_um_filter_36_910]PIZ59717.1 MAG: hypothetical protein COY21_04600 [Sulfurimonas sp. CG_4_10_14_0_2_um_filter_36_1607]PJB85960.1 MAG: hypothetic
MAKEIQELPQNMDMEAVKKMIREREALMRTNSVSLAGTVIDIMQLPQSQKIDKKSGQPVLDDNNQPTFYDDMFWCQIGVVGSEEGVVLNSEQAMSIFKDGSFLFEGRLKNRKFKVETITEL